MSILATNMVATLRSLTKSPITSALDQARKMARRHLETGGNVNAAGGGSDDGVVLPTDIDAGALVAAIAAALRTSSSRRDAQPPSDMLVQWRDGRIVVRRSYIEQLADGDFERGMERLARFITDVRARMPRLIGRQFLTARLAGPQLHCSWLRPDNAGPWRRCGTAKGPLH
jgi:hypothetical protein